MKTTFNGIYRKKEGHGLCGRSAIIRTPSRGEVLGLVMVEIARFLGRELMAQQALTDEGRSFFINLLANAEGNINQAQLEDSLIDALYFESCMICQTEGCREWHQVYDLSGKGCIPHVSECMLEPYEVERGNIMPDIGESIPFDQFIKGKLSQIMSNEAVILACKLPLPDELSIAIYQRGYAECLQDIAHLMGMGNKISGETTNKTTVKEEDPTADV
jgi:hypothetical protein